MEEWNCRGRGGLVECIPLASYAGSGEGHHQHTVIYGRSRSGAFAVVRGWRRGDKNALERSQVQQ